MTKRRLVLVGTAVCLTLAVGPAGWYATRPHSVNRENYERIKKGMTRAEVEAIFGCPPGNYTTFGYVRPPPFGPREWTVWVSNDGEALVSFDELGRVVYSNFGELAVRRPPGLLDRLRAWLGW